MKNKVQKKKFKKWKYIIQLKYTKIIAYEQTKVHIPNFYMT